MNSPTVDATAGSTVSYSNDAPGATITDGVGGPIVDASNTTSYSNGSGTASKIANYSLINNTFSAGSFTIEAFIKINPSGSTNYDAIMGNENGTSNLGWGFGLNYQGKLIFEAYSVAANAYGAATSGDLLSNGVWHHVAAVGTYDAANTRTQVQLYEDYSPVGNLQNYYGSANNTITANPAAVSIGAINPFNGLIDELRITNAPLTTSQMLHAVVPEPGTLALLSLGGAGILLKRRRKA